MPNTTQYVYGVTVPLEAIGYLVTRKAPGEHSAAVAVAKCGSDAVAHEIADALTAVQPTVEEIMAHTYRPNVSASFRRIPKAQAYDAIVSALYLCDHQEPGAGQKAKVIIGELVAAGWLPEEANRA